MADTAATAVHGTSGAAHGPEDPSKRDFLKLIAGSGAIIGAGAIAWPLIDSMNPSKDVLAASSTEVDITPIVEGMGITVMWRGKPIFVRHRTPEEIKEAVSVKLSELPDPQADVARVKTGHNEWLILVGICTHLGCIPTGNRPTDVRGEYGGWFCPCHGSQYDTSGRIRKGPAPANLDVPPYEFMTETKIKIG